MYEIPRLVGRKDPHIDAGGCSLQCHARLGRKFLVMAKAEVLLLEFPFHVPIGLGDERDPSCFFLIAEITHSNIQILAADPREVAKGTVSWELGS
jgi:hypothetical protein